MRYLKVLAASLAIVLLGIWAGHRFDRRRALADTPFVSYAMKIPGKAAAPTLPDSAPRGAPAGAGAEAAKESQAVAARTRPSGLSRLKLIRSGEITLELASYEEGARAADAIARSLDGYVAAARSTSVSGQPASGTLSLRVPADRFDEAFRRLAGLGRVKARQIHTQDVTKQYFDLETRLRVERDAEARLRDVLRDRTARLSDIVEAERELTRVVEEIEQTEGERLYYDRQVAFSTIALDLAEPGIAPAPVAEPSPLLPIRAALRESAFLMASSVAGLIYALAAALPWAAVLALLWLVIRRIRARRSLRLAV
jgi:hypothetical protein